MGGVTRTEAVRSLQHANLADCGRGRCKCRCRGRGSSFEERRLEGAEKRKGKKKEREEFGLVEAHQDGYQEIKQYRFKSKSTLLHSLCHGLFFFHCLGR